MSELDKLAGFLMRPAATSSKTAAPDLEHFLARESVDDDVDLLLHGAEFYHFLKTADARDVAVGAGAGAATSAGMLGAAKHQIATARPGGAWDRATVDTARQVGKSKTQVLQEVKKVRLRGAAGRGAIVGGALGLAYHLGSKKTADPSSTQDPEANRANQESVAARLDGGREAYEAEKKKVLADSVQKKLEDDRLRNLQSVEFKRTPLAVENLKAQFKDITKRTGSDTVPQSADEAQVKTAIRRVLFPPRPLSKYQREAAVVGARGRTWVPASAPSQARVARDAPASEAMLKRWKVPEAEALAKSAEAAETGEAAPTVPAPSKADQATRQKLRGLLAKHYEKTEAPVATADLTDHEKTAKRWSWVTHPRDNLRITFGHGKGSLRYKAGVGKNRRKGDVKRVWKERLGIKKKAADLTDHEKTAAAPAQPGDRLIDPGYREGLKALSAAPTKDTLVPMAAGAGLYLAGVGIGARLGGARGVLWGVAAGLPAGVTLQEVMMRRNLRKRGIERDFGGTAWLPRHRLTPEAHEEYLGTGQEVKTANVERVEANLAQGMTLVEAVRKAYPEYSDEQVRDAVTQMQQSGKANGSREKYEDIMDASQDKGEQPMEKKEAGLGGSLVGGTVGAGTALVAALREKQKLQSVAEGDRNAFQELLTTNPTAAIAGATLGGIMTGSLAGSAIQGMGRSALGRV